MQRLERFAALMDRAVRVPGTSFRVGLDGVLGLVPGVGDVATTLLAGYLFAEAAGLGVRKRTMARMLANTGVDLVFGAIPVLGDLFDFAFKSNAKNARLVIRDVERRLARPRWKESL